jgi:multidrug efflux pump subunit AcrA (membrane-fusion protein)
MYAEAVLTLDKRSGALSIPIEGLNVQSGSTSVYVVGKDHKIEVRPVKIGLETATHVEILSGVAQDDLVVTGNRSQLTPGQVVQPKVIAEPTKETRES